MYLLLACVCNFPIREIYQFLKSVFQELVICCSLWSLCAVLQVLLVPQYTLELPLFSLYSLTLEPPGIQSMPVPHVSLSQIRQKLVPQAAPTPKSWNFRYTFHFSLSLPSQKLFLLIALSCASLGEGPIQMKCSSFSYLFLCTCSWLCASLGYCSFLTGFWSCHKDFLDCILL